MTENRLARHRPAFPSVRMLVVGLLTVSLLLAGCGRSPQEHARFAKAGAAYAAALDALLQVSASITIDAHSARLLQARSLGPVPAVQVKQLADEDRSRLAVIDRLRQHTQLLADYFAELNDLATSSAPDDAAKAIDSTATALGNVGTALRADAVSSLGVNANKFSVGTNFIVSGVIRGALKNELDKRQATIRLELTTQEVLLDALSADIAQNLQVSANVREDLLVNQTLSAGVSADRYDEWIANRRSVLTAPMTIEELGVASQDVAKLRRVFEDLLSGKVDRERIDAVTMDFAALLTVVETLKKPSGGSS